MARRIDCCWQVKKRESLIHRAIVISERACLARSSGVISLTNRAVDHLKSIYPKELKNQRIVVIPTCADLDRFTPSAEKRSRKYYSWLYWNINFWLV